MNKNKTDFFIITCRLLFILFLYLGLYSLGFPPKENIGTGTIFFILISIFFLLIPHGQKISLGRLITFEKEINRVKDEVSDFKTETREVLNLYNSITSTISNKSSTTVNFTLPDKAEVEEAKEELYSTISNSNSSNISNDTTNNEVSTYIKQSGDDVHFALAKLRMELERHFRKILNIDTSMADQDEDSKKLLSTKQLFKLFMKEYPDYHGFYLSFDYILKVCNAAIHGQYITPSRANEVLVMGLTMIKTLKQIEDHHN